MSELVGVLQSIIQNTIKGLKPTEKAVGAVVSVSPLSIQTDSGTQPIPAAAIVLTDSVISRTEKVIGGAGGTVEVEKGLSPGDKVLMLRVDSGNTYIVLSKL